MQIMPSTAAHLGLPMSAIHDAEANVAAAARYMAELQGHFSDVAIRHSVRSSLWLPIMVVFTISVMQWH